MPPQTPPRIRVPAPLHAPQSTRLLEISLSLAVSKRSMPVWPPGAPRGPLQPSQIQKIVGAGAFPPLHPPLRRCATGALLRGARAGLRPTRSSTAISNPNPNPTAISTKTADFLCLCRCARAVDSSVVEIRSVDSADAENEEEIDAAAMAASAFISAEQRMEVSVRPAA
jgi:hypothetical protein